MPLWEEVAMDSVKENHKYFVKCFEAGGETGHSQLYLSTCVLALYQVC